MSKFVGTLKYVGLCWLSYLAGAVAALLLGKASGAILLPMGITVATLDGVIETFVATTQGLATGWVFVFVFSRVYRDRRKVVHGCVLTISILFGLTAVVSIWSLARGVPLADIKVLPLIMEPAGMWLGFQMLVKEA